MSASGVRGLNQQSSSGGRSGPSVSRTTRYPRPSERIRDRLRGRPPSTATSRSTPPHPPSPSAEPAGVRTRDPGPPTSRPPPRRISCKGNRVHTPACSVAGSGMSPRAPRPPPTTPLIAAVSRKARTSSPRSSAYATALRASAFSNGYVAVLSDSAPIAGQGDSHQLIRGPPLELLDELQRHPARARGRPLPVQPWPPARQGSTPAVTSMRSAKPSGCASADHSRNIGFRSRTSEPSSPTSPIR